MRQAGTIVIAGAGIGGLTAALALAREGFRTIVAERSTTLSEAGAGIQLSPNAGRVLAELGLDPALAPLSVEPKTLDIRSGRSGGRIVSLPLEGRAGQPGGFPYRTIHRADLQGVLAEAVGRYAEIDLMLATEVVEFAAHARGITVMVDSAGRHVDLAASALIAADGIRSLVRRAMPGTKELRPARRTAWRAIVSSADAPPFLAADRIGLWLGRDGHIVTYPVRGGREINIVAIVFETLADEGWSVAADRTWIADRFRRWAEPARRIIAAPREWRRWAVATVDPTGAWAMGPVALLGDAAHAMPPFLAQGGAMAIEDASVLAKALAAQPDDPAAALQRYQRMRRPRARRAFRAAQSAGDLYHMSGVTGGFRNAGMKLLGGRRLLARYHWLYSWKPG